MNYLTILEREEWKKNFYEITGIKVKWEPEIKSRIDYMRKLRQYNTILTSRTGVRVNPLTGRLEMSESWWSDRIAEFGKNGKFVRVLQSKALPFKELLDQIFGEHDLEQDDRYSPHILRTNILQRLHHEESDDDIEVEETPEDNGSQFPMELTSDDDFPRASQSAIAATREQVRSSPSRINKSTLRARKSTTRRPNRKRINFESQVQTGFERLEESRTSLLDVLRLRHNSKATFGDAVAVLETLPVQPMRKFWWEANRLLMNDEDVRDGFMKLRNEENKIQFLENLTGVDRYGYPCDIINLRGTSSSATPSLPSMHSQMAGINTNASSSFSQRYEMFDMGSSGTTFSSLLGVIFRIAELHLRGLKNLSDEEITELLLLEEDEILHTHITPLLKYYGKFFCKEPMNQKRGKGWHIIRQQIYENEKEAETGTYMRTVRDEIAKFMWLKKRRGSHYH
ncbi:unnamed protein product [Thlaspi arvense]|uniref:Uncharacterized protein n=1 Tax=Thlaspi arvense TaxID=13288 RepID=A0AAU9S8G0_THLAR|nr:unnamed protein product [Thlaspi arvense]